MALDRLMELAAVEESVPGTLESGAYAAANAKFLVIDPSFSADVEFFQRNFKRSTLTGIEGLAGMKPGTMQFTVETGGQAVTTPDIPPWDILLKACGFKSVVTEKATFTGESGGPFYHGETITGGGAGETAVVIHDTYGTAAGAGTMYVHSASGAFAAGDLSITGGSSGATATLSGDFADAGQSWYPISQETITVAISAGTDPSVGDIITGGTSDAGGVVLSVTAATSCEVRLYTAEIFSNGETVTNATASNTFTAGAITIGDTPTLSLALNIDGTVHYLRGARGNVEFTGSIGEPMLMQFTFQGVVSDPADDSLLIGVDYESKVPPRLLGIGLYTGHEGDADTSANYSPKVSSLTVNMNNQVSPRTSVNDSYGICLFTITNRDASGTMDPEKTLEANFPWIQDFLDGDIWRAGWTLGDTAGNQFIYSMPGLQTTGAPHGERNGQAVRNLAYRVTGGHQTNNDSELGADNELVITYIV